MTRRTLWAWIRRIWITLGLTATVVFVGWSLIAYRASADAHRATRSDAAVTVRHDDGVWDFTPTAAAAASLSATERPAALVFFPGALVDPIAYAPLARAAAEAGFPAHIVELPRRSAFGGADDPRVGERLRRVLAEPTAPSRWVAAGHSRGGVVASTVAAAPPPGFAGLVLIGTSHPRDVDLSGLRVRVTKIVGTRDGLASRAEVEANRALLPATTRWVWIEGGNHAQFGWYGFQPGDHRARIDEAEQHRITIAATIDALRAASSGAPAAPPAGRAADTVRRIEGISYARPAGEVLRLDLFLPAGSGSARPAVVYMFGGGFTQGTRRQFWPHAQRMAELGFVGATIDYRLTPRWHYPAPLDDAQAAVRWLRAHAAEYGVDTSRIAAAGGSAGGYLAAVLGTNQWSGRDWSGADAAARVQAAVLFNPLVDLPQVAHADIGFARVAIDALLATTFADDSAAWQAASPVAHVTARAVPTLFLHGTHDPLYGQSVAMQAQLARAGVRAELYSADTAAHGQLFRAPWAAPTLARMEEFLLSVFPPR